MTKKPSYLGPSDVARRLGVTRDAVYKLLAVHPLDNDAWGANGTPLWLPETIDAWRAKHPKPRGPYKKKSTGGEPTGNPANK